MSTEPTPAHTDAEHSVADDLREALSRFPSGATIVTSAALDGTPAGLTVSAFSPVSLDPPLVLVAVAESSRTLAAIRARGAFIVHILDSRHVELGQRFASDSANKFDGTPYVLNEAGVPHLDVGAIWLECLLEEERQGGDHAIIVGRVTAAHHAEPEDELPPVVYYRRQFRTLEDGSS